MRNLSLIGLIMLFFTGCAVSRKIENDRIEIRLLDEYVLPANTKVGNTVVGGLSGIDHKNGTFYLVSDQPSNPRIYTAEIIIKKDKIDTVIIDQLIKVKKTGEFSNDYFDLEAIRYDPSREVFVVSSEGKIDSGKDPGIYTLSILGETNTAFKLPFYFKAAGKQRPRNNGVFEGLSQTYDKKGYWAATELPLEMDGAKPKIFPTRSHIRITKFNEITGEAVNQFAYKLDGISKLPINYFAVNGLTELLEVAPDRFLVLERSYSAGYGSYGNTVKIFEVDASQATNTLDLDKLKGEKYTLAGKRLLFDFKNVKDKLTNRIIDNIEGLCLGPELSNGNKSLVLISDNNFNSFGAQLNQIILMEIDFKDPEISAGNDKNL